MFGSSPKDGEVPEDLRSRQQQVVNSANAGPAPTTKEKPADIAVAGSMDGGPNDAQASPRKDRAESPVARKSEEISPNGEKRSRRASGVAKAKEMFSSAKSSFASPSPTRNNPDKAIQTPIQKLGKTDPALSVPQGSLNNAAGESNPGPRSTFRVGVTEDKNKKCRRTMEDTHAYLYNFLSTPAPSVDGKMSKILSNSSAGSGQQPTIETDNGYFAIFDGHAGTFAAEWCGKKLHLLLEDMIRRNPNRAIPELLDETFTSVDQQLEKLPLKNSGCTAVIAVLRWEDRIPNSQSATGSTAIAPATAAAIAKESSNSISSSPPEVKDTTLPSSAGQSDVPAVEAKIREASSRQRVLYTANVGDARIVLCRNGKALRLSYDHKGSDDNEGKRIANAGGLILNNRVNGVLAVTRALGDAYMKDLVTGHPYTTETVIQPDIDEFLILACDGLWDVCSDQDAVDLIRQTHDPQQASKQLVEHALARFSTDNLSCMVIRFNTRAVQDAVDRRAEPIGVEGDPPSSVKGGISEADAIVSQAKKELLAHNHADGEIGTGKVTTEMIKEQEEEQAGQETGPELDAEGLKKAREKAKEGQEEVQVVE